MSKPDQLPLASDERTVIMHTLTAPESPAVTLRELDNLLHDLWDHEPDCRFGERHHLLNSLRQLASKSSGSRSDTPSTVTNRSTPRRSTSWRAERRRWLPTGRTISGSARPGQRRFSANEPGAVRHDRTRDRRANHLAHRITAALTCRSTSRTSIRGSWSATNMAPRPRFLAA